MFNKQTNASVRPHGLGAGGQSSLYGNVIPLIYGRTRTAISLIWWNNFRQIGHVDGKKGKGKQPIYGASVDFLLGHNPIVAPLQVWENRDGRHLLEQHSTTLTVASGSSQILSWSDSKFYCVTGVTIKVSVAATINDYGGGGSITGTGEFGIPLWNLATHGPNPGRPHAARHWPFCFYWLPGDAPSIKIPAIELGIMSAYVSNPSAIEVTIYYETFIEEPPINRIWMGFEPELGAGPGVVSKEYSWEPGNYGWDVALDNMLNGSNEYSGHEDQQIKYPPFSGAGTYVYNLGVAGILPNIRMEILGSYPSYPGGDCDFADIIEDILAGGQTQPYYGSLIPLHPLPRGLGCYDWPAAVQAYQQYSPTANDASSHPVFHRGG